MEKLYFQTEITASKQLVWWAWTKTERIVKWFAPSANIDARVGGAFELFFDPTNHDHLSTKGCQFTLLEPFERLGFTWKSPDDFAAVMNTENSLTTVLVTLHEDNGTTVVNVEHAGWGQGAEWEQARQWHHMAWTQVLASLKSQIESGEGELCCAP